MADPDKDDVSPKGALSQASRDEFKQRLDTLGEKLDKASGTDQQDQHGQSRGSAFGIAMRMGTEFVVAVLIGGVMGWYLDKWLGSTPFMLFIFMMFGFAAGTMNIIRVGKSFNMSKNDMASDETKQS